MSAVYKLPYDTPLRYLPLVYMLPCDLLVRCPTLYIGLVRETGQQILTYLLKVFSENFSY